LIAPREAGGRWYRCLAMAEPAASWVLASLVLAAASPGCGGDPAPPDPSSTGRLPLALVPITLEGGLPAITEIAFIPGTAELLVLSKSHTVVHVRLDGDRAVRLGEFEVPNVEQTSDCGLLSVAFDPAFATNRLVYFAACDSVDYSRITRHEFDPAAYGKIASSAATILRVGKDGAAHAWHNIGSIGFDRDGYLWALFGDKTDAPAAQDPAGQLGAVLRIAPNLVGDGYTPAPGNPFVGMAGRNPDVVAYGLRSPWRGALDHAGRLWIGDVGDSSFEEINVTRFLGENFGAGRAEGPCTQDCAQLTDPVAWWDRSNDSRYAREDSQVVPTTRRVVWVGAEYPRDVPVDRYAGLLFDHMLVGDFAAGWIRAIQLDEQGAVVSDEAAGHLVGATAWAVGPDGYLYASSYGGSLAWPYPQGALYRAVLTDD